MIGKIFRYPVNYVAITQKFIKNKHYGLDLGWNSKYGGKNQPVYASADGIVYSLKDYDKSNKSWGNYVKIKHDQTIYTLYAHLKDGIVVKKGDNVKQGDLIGYTGNTGDAVGNHVHFEIYMGGAETKYRIDPLPLTYVFDNQITSSGETKNIVNYYLTIKATQRDTNKNQIKILKDDVKVRKTPTSNGTVVGRVIKDSIYDDLEVIESDGNKWHKIGENNYLAEADKNIELLPKQEENLILEIIDALEEIIILLKTLI